MADKKKRESRDSHWADGLEGYSRQIWLAGLGAYTRMGKEGAKLFESLIRDGEQAEQAAEAEAEKVSGKGSRSKKDPLEGARSKVDKARSKLTDKLGGLEDMFDKRVASAVERLGLARQEELQVLESRIAELTGAVEQLSAKPTRPRKPPAAAAAAPAQAAPKRRATSKSIAAKPATPRTAKAAASKDGADNPVKTTTRRRTTVPKAATRGKSAPAPASRAEPGKPSEQ